MHPMLLLYRTCIAHGHRQWASEDLGVLCRGGRREYKWGGGGVEWEISVMLSIIKYIFKNENNGKLIAYGRKGLGNVIWPRLSSYQITDLGLSDSTSEFLIRMSHV